MLYGGVFPLVPLAHGYSHSYKQLRFAILVWLDWRQNLNKFKHALKVKKPGTLQQARSLGFRQALSEKGGVVAVSVVAFAYDIYTNPSNKNGVLLTTLTILCKLPAISKNKKAPPVILTAELIF